MQKRQLIVHEDTESLVAEAYRTMRTNIQFTKADSDLRVIMFTSVGSNEGKSTTVANTAIAMAQTGKKVIIVDCDLRRPVQHIVFGKENRGLTNILVERDAAADLIQDTGINNLQILASGPIPPNPSELLGSAKMREIIDSLKLLADIVIIDSPPTIAVTDACVLASKVDGILLVLDSGSIKPEMAQRAKELLLKANGQILGVVLNRVEIEPEYLHYYYYYGNEGRKVVSDN